MFGDGNGPVCPAIPRGRSLRGHGKFGVADATQIRLNRLENHWIIVPGVRLVHAAVYWPFAHLMQPHRAAET
jgi:hypothetical protein